MLQSNEEVAINTIEVDILNAETESPDLIVRTVTNNTNFTTRALKPSSVVTVTVFITVGLLAFIFTIMYKNKKNKNLMQCVVDVKSYYINYGSTNLQLPQFMTQICDTQEKSLTNNKRWKKRKTNNKKRFCKLLNDQETFNNFKPKQITMISDLWKAKSQQSNNYFVINIIPEEDELEDGTL